MANPSHVPTFGLTHVALAVRNVEKSLRFYHAVVGAVTVYQQDGFAQAQTPGSRDVLVFERSPKHAGKAGGIVHFGFRLRKAVDINKAVRAVRKAGGRVLSQGEFVPGEPYVFFKDPDGYEVEIWYEFPTSVDPKLPRSQGRRPRRTS